jgi:CelD/BcsL family acetyltransferase involved in cellulose biosynthesis
MSVLAAHADRSAARPTRRVAVFRVELLHDWKAALAHWRDISPSTPFQHPQWYDAWYAAFAGAVTPLIAVVTAASTGR